MAPSKSRKPRLALVGSDSLKGKEILSIFAARKFPVATFELYDPDVEEEYSKLSQFRGEAKVVHALTPEALIGLDLVFLAVTAGFFLLGLAYLRACDHLCRRGFGRPAAQAVSCTLCLWCRLP